MAKVKKLTELEALAERVEVLEILVGKNKIALYHEGVAATKASRERSHLHADLRPFREKVFQQFCKARLEFGDGHACYRWGVEGAYRAYVAEKIEANAFDHDKREHVLLSNDEIKALMLELDGVTETILRTAEHDAKMPSWLGVTVKAEYRYATDVDECDLEVQTIARGARGVKAVAATA